MEKLRLKNTSTVPESNKFHIREIAAESGRLSSTDSVLPSDVAINIKKDIN
jgi:hypothetical protein